MDNRGDTPRPPATGAADRSAAPRAPTDPCVGAALTASDPMAMLARLRPTALALACAAICVQPRAQAQDVAPDVDVRTVDGVLTVDGAAIEDDAPWPDGAPNVVRLAPAGAAPALHVVWPGDGLPDARDTHALLVTGRGGRLQLGARWEDERPTRLVATDLDGDGNDELVRDRAAALPCGLEGWWTPEVWVARERAFSPVSVRASRPAEAIDAPAVRATTDLVAVAAPFAWSTGAVDGDDALVDADPSTAWIEAAPGAGVGQWIAIRAPLGTPIRGLRMSVGPGPGPVSVLVRTDTGASAVVAFDDAFREAALDLDGACAVVTLLEAGGRDSVRVRELSLVTDADRAAPEARAAAAWPAAVASACGAGDPAAAARAARRAIADVGPGAAVALAREDDPCGARALAAAMAASEATDVVAAAVADTTSPTAQRALLEAVEGTDGASAVATAVLAGARGDAWEEALRRLAAVADEPSHAALVAILETSATDPSLRPLAADLAATWSLPAWTGPSALPQDDESATWILALANRMPPGAFAAPPAVLGEALARDNGSVARLAVLAIAHHGLDPMRDAIVTMLADPAPHLRAAAVAAADALGLLAARAEEMGADPSATVRLAFAGSAAARDLAVDHPAEVAAELGGEAWIEVRRARIDTLVGADRSQADEALAGALAALPGDVPFALRRWATRATPVPAPVFDLARSGGADPDTLPWALALLPLAEGACDDLGWLGDARDAAGVPEPLRQAIDEAVSACP